jgi:phospholipid transport system substrate-binding protein
MMASRPRKARRLVPSLLALALLASATHAHAADTRTPTEVIQETANALALRVSADRTQLEDNPTQLYTLVDEVLLPVFDTRYAGQLVLGRHGRAASKEQRDAFVDTYYDYLLRNYASSVLKFDKDKVEVFPPRPGDPNDPKRTVVRTSMLLDDGGTAAVDYSLRLTDDGWRIFDVRIDGISYVQTYRSQFDSEISARGLDAVIERLRAETERLGTAGREGTSTSANPEPGA